MTDDYALRLDAVSRRYVSQAGDVTVLNDVTTGFVRGQLTAVMGPSGSGKTTLLQCAAGLDRPTAGRVWLGDIDLTSLGDHALDRVRRDRIGFIFQAYNLLSILNVYDNVTLPLRMAGRKPARGEVSSVLDVVGLAGLDRRRPAELSGGQQQRVAIARSLVTRPEVLFADEPTGALDTATGRQVLDLLRATVDRYGQTVVMVTHDPGAAARADTVLFLVDGHIHSRLHRPTLGQVTAQIGVWER
ncbi:ABC transporter ATP-binding protein [Micromonospora sp. NPDC003197]